MVRKLSWKSAALGTAVILAIAGCSGSSEHQVSRGLGDVPVGEQDRTSPRLIINFPDAWGNVAFKCMGVNGLYNVTHNDASRPPVTVVVNDPMCKKDAG